VALYVGLPGMVNPCLGGTRFLVRIKSPESSGWVGRPRLAGNGEAGGCRPFRGSPAPDLDRDFRGQPDTRRAGPIAQSIRILLDTSGLLIGVHRGDPACPDAGRRPGQHGGPGRPPGCPLGQCLHVRGADQRGDGWGVASGEILRASLVGSTQSNISIPSATNCTKSYGVPMPIK